MPTYIYTIYGGSTEVKTSETTWKLQRISIQAQTPKDAHEKVQAQIPEGSRVISWWRDGDLPPPDEY